MNEKFIFPVKKKNYPVYLYSNKTDREVIKRSKMTKIRQSPAMFPILSIEGIGVYYKNRGIHH